MHNGGSKEQGIRRRSCTVFRAAAALLCLPGAALAVLRSIPWDLGTPWIQLLALFPASLVLTAVALAVAVLALCLEPVLSRTILAASVAAVMLLQLAMVFPRLLPSEGTAGPSAAPPPARLPATERTITVMALNVGATGVDAEALLAEVRAHGVDILALPELAPAGRKALDGAGLAAELPHRVLDVGWTGTGSAVFSAFPLAAEERVPGTAFHQSRAVAAVPGAARGINLTAVHVASPRPGNTPSWRRELRQLGELHRTAAGAHSSILLGDFNASQDHREFRALLSTGLTDAAQVAGKGLAPTWPANSPVPPFVTLDHILVTPDIGIRQFSTFLVPGTDHAGIVAELVVGG